MYISINIKYLLWSNKMTATDLAKRLGVKTATVSAYTTGVTNPSVDVLAKISEIFGVSVDNIIKIDLQNDNDLRKSNLETQNLAVTEGVKKLTLSERVEILEQKLHDLEKKIG